MPKAIRIHEVGSADVLRYDALRNKLEVGP